MAGKPVQKAVPKAKVGDVEKKGVKKGQNKKTSIGASKNSKPNDKRTIRERKGR